MINPNKLYTVPHIMTITAINPRTSEVTVRKGEHTFTGYLDRLTKQPTRYSIGTQVQVRVQYSILMEAYMIKQIKRIKTANIPA